MTRLLSQRMRFAILLLAICPIASRGDDLRLEETDAAITVRSGDTVVLVYNKQAPTLPEGMNPIYKRSGFIHPVRSPQGLTVTDVYPPDHAHQDGIFAAWVRTNYDGREIDFWNLPGKTGRVLHDRVVATYDDDSDEKKTVGFEVELIHRIVAEPQVDVLRERWKVTVHPREEDYFCFDLQTTQNAITEKPLIVSKYHYGGVALRGPAQWIVPGKSDASDSNADAAAKPRLFTDAASDRLAGNHQPARWVTLSGTQDGREVSISVMSHPENFRSPQMVRLHPTKPYFCFAPCVAKPLKSRKPPVSRAVSILGLRCSPRSSVAETAMGCMDRSAGTMNRHKSEF
ncbi:MAG: DUF6807 family protein [Pirellulaceae bacterium]